MIQFALDYFSIAYSLFPIVIVGCYGYRQLNVFYKLFLFQSIITMVFYAIIAYNFNAENQWLFNVYIVLESVILICAPATVITKRSERLWILAGFLLFATAYIANLYANGKQQLLTRAMAIESVPVLIIYTVLIYRTSQNASTHPMLWLCLGIVLYSCGIVPAVGFITPYFTPLSNLFQSSIIEPLGHLRYFLAALSISLYLRRLRISNMKASSWPKER